MAHRFRAYRVSFGVALIFVASACADEGGGGDPLGPQGPAPRIVTDSLAMALVGLPYRDTLRAAEGDGTYTWSLAGGALPPGLVLSQNGVIDGTPQGSGTTEFSVRVESARQSVTKPMAIRSSVIFVGGEAVVDTTDEAGLASLATESFGGGIFRVSASDGEGRPVAGAAVSYYEARARGVLAGVRPSDGFPPVILVGRPDSIAAGAERSLPASGAAPVGGPHPSIGLEWQGAVPIAFLPDPEYDPGDPAGALHSLGQLYWEVGPEPGVCSTYREIAVWYDSTAASEPAGGRMVFSTGSRASPTDPFVRSGAASATFTQLRSWGETQLVDELVGFSSRTAGVVNPSDGDSPVRAWFDSVDAFLDGALVPVVHVQVDPHDPFCGGRVPTDLRLRSEPEIEAEAGSVHTIQVQALHNPGDVPVPGLRLEFGVSAGGLRPVGQSVAGTSSLESVTDDEGIATVEWTLPDVAGSWSLAATVDWAGHGYTLADSIGVQATTRVPPIPPGCEPGSTYYVDPDGGDDANDGLSAVEAWRTLQRPNEHTFGPGECLLFKRGSTSLGQLTMDHLDSGAFGAPLILDTYEAGGGATGTGARPGSASPWGGEPASGFPPGGTASTAGASEAPGALCNGDELAVIHQTATTGGGLTGHGVLLNSTQHVTLRNLHLVGPGIQNDRSERGAEECVTHGGCGLLVYTDGSLGRRVGVQAHCMVAEGWDRAGFQVASTSPSKVGYSDVLFQHSAALGNGKAGFASDGAFSPAATEYAHADIRLLNSVAHHNPGRQGDRTSHSGNGIMLSDVDGALVRDSRAYENGASSNWPGGGPVGIWAWDATNVTLEGNWSYDNRSGLTAKDGGGFDFDGGVTHSRMIDNRSWGNDGPGYLVYQFDGARGETAHNEVADNHSTDDARTNGAALFLGGFGQNVDRVHSNRFTNNTIAGPHGPAVGFLGPVGAGNEFSGNDFTGHTGDPTVRSELDLSTNQVLFLGNAYPAGFVADWFGTVYRSLASWLAATGQEPAS